MIRLFCAVAIPFDLAETLVRRQSGLPGARWRPAETLHITLRFFGETPENLADDIDGELTRVSSRPFDLSLEGVGAFGEGDKIRAVWAGVSASEPLNVLAGRCERAARRAGLAPESRNFAPHVTLAYLRRPDPGRVAAWLQGHNLLKSPKFLVDRFGLYSSWPGPDGSSYQLEREYPLG